jgi:hypothetical protein
LGIEIRAHVVHERVLENWTQLIKDQIRSTFADNRCTNALNIIQAQALGVGLQLLRASIVRVKDDPARKDDWGHARAVP